MCKPVWCLIALWNKFEMYSPRHVPDQNDDVRMSSGHSGKRSYTMRRRYFVLFPFLFNVCLWIIFRSFKWFFTTYTTLPLLLVSKCPIDKGYIRNDNGECVCPPGTALNNEEECRRCVVELGFKVDERGRCVCALDRGLIIDERGRCICPVEHGYSLNIHGQCVPSMCLTRHIII